MTKNPEIYVLPDEAFYIRQKDYPDFISVIESVLKCYELFDSVVLDVERKHIEALLANMKSISMPKQGNLKIELSRGMRADLCSCLSQAWEEYAALSKRCLKVEESKVRFLMDLAFGDAKLVSEGAALS